MAEWMALYRDFMGARVRRAIGATRRDRVGGAGLVSDLSTAREASSGDFGAPVAVNEQLFGGGLDHGRVFVSANKFLEVLPEAVHVAPARRAERDGFRPRMVAAATFTMLDSAAARASGELHRWSADRFRPQEQGYVVGEDGENLVLFAPQVGFACASPNAFDIIPIEVSLVGARRKVRIVFEVCTFRRQEHWDLAWEYLN
eukprot:SAG31_NODE_173_length_21354_cov_16.826112_11_plen_201_part_00